MPLSILLNIDLQEREEQVSFSLSLLLNFCAIFFNIETLGE